MRPIRASEIGTYLYCQRAWWFQLHGHTSDNQADLVVGHELHDRHGRTVIATGCIRALAYAFLLLAVVLVTIYFTRQLV